MTLAFNGRVEALIDVPGGVTVSASTGAHTSAVTVTIPEGSYYLSEAGGVESLIDTLETELNENVQGYPQHAAAMQAAVNYGTWSAGWLFNITSGNDTGAFGGTTLTAVSTPVYSIEGPRGGIDLAVGFNSAADAFSGGAVYDVGANDLCVAWVGSLNSTPGAYGTIISKIAAATASGWAVYVENTGPTMGFIAIDGGGLKSATISAASLVGCWYVGMACLDRSTGKIRLAVYNLSNGDVTISSETTVSGNVTTAANFTIGASAWVDAPLTTYVAAAYVGTGSGAATGLSANLSAAVTSLALAVNSSFAVSMSTTTGLVSITNSFWSSYVQFTTDAARSLLGFEYSFDYPQTAAQVTAALGGIGDFTGGAGYLCNETSGDLASVFGTPAALTDGGTPTYSNVGARGGADKAFGLDTNTDYFDGGDYWNVGASDDLVIVWVGKFSALPSAYSVMFSRTAAAFSNGWAVFQENSTPRVQFTAGASNAYNATADGAGAFHIGEPHVGIAVIERATGKIRVATRSLVTSDAVVGSEVTIANAIQVSGTFRIGDCAWTTGCTNFQCSAFYVGYGSGAATGLSAGMSTALASFAAYMKAQTGTAQAKALWFPNTTFNIDDEPNTAPVQNDLRETISPTGQVFGLCSNERYEHANATWERVPLDRYREAEAEYANASLEVFWRDTQAGTGHDWLGPRAKVQIYWDNAGTQTLVGADEDISGWWICGAGGIRDVAKKTEAAWTGHWTVRFPKLITNA
jgi:hypothetical protein